MKLLGQIVFSHVSIYIEKYHLIQPIISWFSWANSCVGIFQPSGPYRKNVPFKVPRGKYRSKGSNLVRCEKVAAHREHILFQLYFSTGLRTLG